MNDPTTCVYGNKHPANEKGDVVCQRRNKLGPCLCGIAKPSDPPKAARTTVVKLDTVRPLFAGSVTPATQASLVRFEAALLEALSAAITDGLPQGLLVAVLAGHTHMQTQRMVDNAP